MSADPSECKTADFDIIKTINYDEGSLNDDIKHHQFTSMVFNVLQRCLWVNNKLNDKNNKSLNFDEYRKKCVSIIEKDEYGKKYKICAEDNLLDFVNSVNDVECGEGVIPSFEWLIRMNKRTFESLEPGIIYFGLAYSDNYYYVAFRLKSDKKQECNKLRELEIWDAFYHHKSCCKYDK